MRINDDQPRMHGNPEMRGRHERHGDGGLSEWGHRDRQDRGDTGYGNPPRFDQHGGQTGRGWHSQGSGGIGRSAGSMGGGDDRDDWRDQTGASYGYQGGGYGDMAGGGGQFGSRYGGGQYGQGNHYGQDSDRPFGNNAGSMNRSGRPNDIEGRAEDLGRQIEGFDQQRYGQQGLGSYGGRDHPQSWGEAQDAYSDRDDHYGHEYRNWRDHQMQAFDRDYDEFRRHRQERFAADFEEWRKSRGGRGSEAAGGTGEER